MIYNMLGKTNLVISAVGLGGIPLQRLDREKAVETVRYALERGVNFICEDIAVHERETRFHDLDADMILLTEHDADRLIFSEHERPALAHGGKLRAYQMALGERYRLLAAERIHCDIVEPQLGHA